MGWMGVPMGESLGVVAEDMAVAVSWCRKREWERRGGQRDE